MYMDGSSGSNNDTRLTLSSFPPQNLQHPTASKTREETLTRNLGKEVVTDQSDHGVDSALHIIEPEQPRMNSCPALGHQSSVKSLSMDEFQNTTDTSDGKSFGSMNMDEFLSLWAAEAQAENANTMVPTAEAKTSLTNMNPQYHVEETPNESSNIARQMSLTGQGSLGSLSGPAPLCLKTVGEVRSDIGRTQQSTSTIPCAGSKQRQISYGKWTLEDFLVHAGVVCNEGAKAQTPPPGLHPHPHHHLAPPQLQPRPAPFQFQPGPQPPYGMYLNWNSTTVSSSMIIGCGGTGSVGVPTIGGTVKTCVPGGISSAFVLQPTVSCYDGGVANGVCVTKSFGETGPVSSNGTNKAGGKRKIDGPLERVAERRDERIIKNRESAARCRERKRAYVVELEAELNELKHENVSLRQTLAEMESKSEQLQRFEAAKAKVQAEAQEKPLMLKRSLSI